MGQANRWIKIDEPQVAYRDDFAELSARISSSDDLFSPFKLWFRYPLAYSKYINKTGDPFLAALLPLAMAKNYQLQIESSVSEYLFENTQQIMTIMSSWFSPMKQVDVKADSLRSDTYNSNKVGSFFSGGIDSFYTVLKNLKKFKNESRISHLIFVHGFDIDIENYELYNKVSESINTVSKELELATLNVKTNLRVLTDNCTQWGYHQHGAALAGVGLGLSKLFKTIFIPSSHTYSGVLSYGSHPLLDPLWSTESTEFIHDGNEASRSQKVKREISYSQTALTHLRVCWENPGNRYNCGRCKKCFRTKLNLKMAGVLEQCKTLDHNIDLNKYAKFIKNSSVERHELYEIIQFGGDNKQFKKELENLLKNNFNTLWRNRFKTKIKSVFNGKK